MSVFFNNKGESKCRRIIPGKGMKNPGQNDPKAEQVPARKMIYGQIEFIIAAKIKVLTVQPNGH
jgi:hypothetical protein